METVCQYLLFLRTHKLLKFDFSSKAIDAYVVQVIVIANHMNGKDTHVRGLRVLGPLEYVVLLSYRVILFIVMALER